MDKTKHSDGIIVLTYSVMAFCWAGKSLLTAGDMIVCGLSGFILGLCIVLFEKLKRPVYVCRGIGAFFRALFIIEIYFFTGWADSPPMTIIGSMIPPAATGAMLIEGLCTSASKSGRNKIVNAIVISISLAVGVYVAVAITRYRGLM